MVVKVNCPRDYQHVSQYWQVAITDIFRCPHGMLTEQNDSASFPISYFHLQSLE